MSAVRPLVAILRFEEYGPLFLLCGVAGAMLAGVVSMVSLLGLLCFIGSFSASAFVLNDITDWRQDATEPGHRNPISQGALRRSSAVAIFFVLAALSLASLALVGLPALYAAPLVYGLYWGYSWGPQFKARAGLDIAVHGAVPALYVFMGSALGVIPPLGAVLLAGVVFCFAAMSGVLQEVRDIEKDSGFRKTTASVLGTARSLDLSAALLFGGAAIFSAAALLGPIPLPMLALAPLSCALYSPLRAWKSGKVDGTAAISSIRARGLVLTIAVLAAYAALAAYPF